MPADLITILRSILAQPTAPFFEDAVRAEILMHLAQLPHVRCTQDHFGNVIAQYEHGAAEARHAFAAHMDHPGYVGEEFLGGVPSAYLESAAPRRDFGAFAMWDLPAFVLEGGLVHSRACDDLVGCASIVALFQALEEASATTNVYGLFTRAEEVGFLGAIELGRSGRVPAGITIISLECSSELSAGAGKMGEGVIIRVGDKTSLFDDAATRELVAVATGREIPHQRALMSGGTCEATAYQLYGYRCAALCVALGNYHNCGAANTIAAEFVALKDVQSLLDLMTAVATQAEVHDGSRALRAKLESGLKKYERFLPPF